jgi:hypothetical protein
MINVKGEVSQQRENKENIDEKDNGSRINKYLPIHRHKR